MTGQPVTEYEIDYRTGAALLNFSGASEAERAAARRLMAFHGSAEDVATLKPLAELIGLPWRELFPEDCRQRQVKSQHDSDSPAE